MEKFKAEQFPEKEKTAAEKLKEKIYPRLKQARTYIAALMIGMGAEQGINTKLHVERGPVGVAMNSIIETSEDMQDVLQYEFGVKDEADGPIAQVEVGKGGTLMSVAEEELRKSLEVGADRKPSWAGEKWVYQQARHLARLNNIADVSSSIEGKSITADTYNPESFKSFANNPALTLFEKEKNQGDS